MNHLAPKAKNKLGIASSIPPNMAERFGSAVLPYLQSVQGLFPPTNPYGQATSNFLLGQAPQAAQRMAEGYPNVLFDTRNPLGGNRIVNPAALDMAAALPVATALKGAGLAKGGVAATFAGVGAKTADREALALATTPKVEADFSGTKILDAEGEPLVVYHGTDDVFDTFNPKLTRDIGSHFGAQEQAVKFGKNIMPVHLNIRNPLPMDDVFSRQDGLGDAWRTIDAETNVTPAERDTLEQYKRAVDNKWSDDRDADNSKIKEFKQFWKLAEKVIRRSGFDGIVYRNKVEGDFDSYVVFDPKQIKSAGPSFKKAVDPNNPKEVMLAEYEAKVKKWDDEAKARNLQKAASPESQAIARYREIKGPKSVVRMEAALRTAGVPLPKNEPVAYIQGLVDRAHRRN
jgi:hypothetical protein